MKIMKIFIVITSILFSVLSAKTSDKPKISTSYVKCSDVKTIIVPIGKSENVVLDGTYKKAEWDDALSYSVAEKYEIYLQADSGILCIGLKAKEPVGELVCEIRMTSNEREVFLLHVSGALGEGVSGFPATTKFEINNNKNWHANILKPDSVKNADWFNSGMSVELYKGIYEKRDGIEFKINRKKLNSNSLKLTISWVTIDVKENGYIKNKYNFPGSATLKNADNWTELILPILKM